MNAVAILNPNAGAGKTVQLPPTTEVLETRAPGHAVELTRSAIKRGARTVIAIGGDGTVNEVVNGFFEDERMIATDAELAIVPQAIRVWVP